MLLRVRDVARVAVGVIALSGCSTGAGPSLIPGGAATDAAAGAQGGGAPSWDAGAGAPSGDAAGGGAVQADGGGTSSAGGGDGGDAGSTPQADAGDVCALSAADLTARDALAESAMPQAQWYAASMQGGWGPAAAAFPAVSPPAGCDPVTWKRQRVLQAAEHSIGLPYQHHHIPKWDPSSAWSGAEGPGLDCSNFTAWAYNFGLGMQFTSDVVAQADGATAPGRQLAASEPFEPGDILFITAANSTTIAHAVIYVDAGHIIDDTGPGVQIRPFTGWYQQRYSHARRMIE